LALYDGARQNTETGGLISLVYDSDFLRSGRVEKTGLRERGLCEDKR
jgi:hypothetical protein